MRPESEIRAEFEAHFTQRNKAALTANGVSLVPDEAITKALAWSPRENEYIDHAVEARWMSYLTGYRAAEKRFAEWHQTIVAVTIGAAHGKVEVIIPRETWTAMRKEFGR